MTTEQFSKEQFEEVLADFCAKNSTSYKEKGYVVGEFRYQVDVSDISVVGAASSNKVVIEIASSIGRNGFADPTGDNSIRIWLTDVTGLPLGNKFQKWVTRVSGWEARLTDKLDRTFSVGKKITFCEKCSSMRKIWIVKKEGPNKGRLFIRCNCQNNFQWLDDTDEEDPTVPNCPRCGSRMVMRNGRNGKFYGCSQYPVCTGTRNLIPTTTEQVVAEPEISKPEVVNTPVGTGQKFVPSTYQLAVFQFVQTMKAGNHLVVEAAAGSGKTTTGVEMLKLINSSKEVLFIAFNKHIERKLSEVAPQHVKVRTYHGLGYSICRDTYGKGIMVTDDKIYGILENFMSKDDYGYLFPTIRRLVSLVKDTLSGVEDGDLTDLCDHYGIELNGDTGTVFEATRYAVAKSRTMTNALDFDDMCWLPVVNNLAAHKYDVIFIDEAQDTNKVQIALALMSVKEGGNIIAVGDRHQSLYGFRGADVDAIPNLISNLNAATLPLSITYRNPKEIVRLVNERFPGFPLEAAEWAPDGLIRYVSEELALTEYTPGDMVLCRVNAKLVYPAFALIRNGVKAIIRGRDIGKGLLVLVKKMKTNDLNTLLEKLGDYKRVESTKLLLADKNTQAQSLEDKVDTIIALSDGVVSVSGLESRIEEIFSDDNEGVVFSSVHRAKGLEAKRVFILAPELMPHPMAKKDWEMEQEKNVEYVALTRCMSELIFVS